MLQVPIQDMIDSYSASYRKQLTEARKRVTVLEQQIQLLWGVLHRLPVLRGIYDAILIESDRQGAQPMLPEQKLKTGNKGD